MTRTLLTSLFVGLFMLPICSPTFQDHALANPRAKSVVPEDQERATKEPDAHHDMGRDKKRKKEPLAKRIEEKAEETLRHLLKHQGEIGLSDEQVSQLRTMKLDFERVRIRSKADIEVAEVELKALLKESSAALPAIEAKIRETQQFKGDLIFTAIKTKRAALDLLNPEQRDRAKAIKKQMSRHAELTPSTALGEEDAPPMIASHGQNGGIGQ